jgi:hypothetical protein
MLDLAALKILIFALIPLKFGFCQEHGQEYVSKES